MAKKQTMKIHPLCRMFGQIAPISKEDRQKMLEDIRDNGVKVPLLVNKKLDTILDGATRWGIAYDLKMDLDPDKHFEVFPSTDEDEIQREILSRNLFRRHMSDDQRVALVSKLLGPKLEADAKARQAAGGSFKGKQKLDGKGSVAAQIAKTAGVSKHKGEQSEKARKAGLLDDVLSGQKLSAAAKKSPTKARKPKKVVSFEDAVYSKWTVWLNRFPQPKRREVIELVKGWVGSEAKKK